MHTGPSHDEPRLTLRLSLLRVGEVFYRDPGVTAGLGIGQHMAAARRLRLGRLRLGVVRRMQPLSTRLPLLEHATAVLDARVLTVVFQGWSEWTRAVQALRTRMVAARLRRLFDRCVVFLPWSMIVIVVECVFESLGQWAHDTTECWRCCCCQL